MTELRFRVEHAQILHPADIPRFARLGVIASMQPTHATSDLMVLSSDIMRVPPPEILHTTVRMTVVGGKVVYEQENAR
ncbi:MAG: hypothetical protein HY657_11430 [Acidobacteria bacterium]|nr:hypothetical protein [Acidobacteriota bacterium]